MRLPFISGQAHYLVTQRFRSNAAAGTVTCTVSESNASSDTQTFWFDHP